MRRDTRDVRPSRPRDEGSIIITMTVMLVATGLVLATVAMTHRGLSSSRRAGDSANALQLADAGINHAVKRAAETNVASFSETESLGDAGSYTFTATRDPATATYHVDAYGTDSTGVQRRIQANAVPEPIFSNALFGKTAIKLHAGVGVDSYRSGSNAAEMCTGRGYVGTNSADDFGQTGNGSGNGVTNCGGIYPYDGCISYADSDPPDIPSEANCPQPIIKQTPAYNVQDITPPPSLGAPTAQPANICNGSGIPAGRYYWHSVTLPGGCKIDPAGGDGSGVVQIWTAGSVALGNSNGTGGDVNAPVTSGPFACPTGGGYSTDYCPGWPGRLQVYAFGGSQSVCFNANQTNFWGVIHAPSRAATRCGSGGSHFEVWGALVFNDIDTHSQFHLHYDESLASIHNNKYVTRNWREEPL